MVMALGVEDVDSGLYHSWLIEGSDSKLSDRWVVGASGCRDLLKKI